MTSRPTTHRRAAVRLAAAPLAAALLLGATPAGADWMPKPSGATVAGGIAVAGVGWSLKKNLGEAGDQIGEMVSAAIRGDTAEVGRLSGDLMKLPVDIAVDAFPVLTVGAGALDAVGGAGEKVRRRLEAAKRRVGQLAGAAGETVADARVALAVDEDDRRWYESAVKVLDRSRLAAVTVPRTRHAPDPGTRADPWGTVAKTGEPSRDAGASVAKVDPWAPDAGQGRAAAPAARGTDVWAADAGARAAVRRDGRSGAAADPWAPDAGRGWDVAADTPALAAPADAQADAQWQDEYAVALNRLLGLSSGDDGYEAALDTVERMEIEAVRRQEERERLARLEAEEREQARLAEEERRRQMRLAEARREAESRRRSGSGLERGIQSGLAIVQGQLAFVQQLQDQQRQAEAARQRRLAAIDLQQAQQRQAEQQARFQEQQRRQEEQRRQAERQASLEGSLRKALRYCSNKKLGFGTECISGLDSAGCFRKQEEERAAHERSKQKCKRDAWSRYERSGGATILGIERL